MIGNRGIAIAEDSTIIETARRRSFTWISEKIPLNRGDDLRVDDPRCAGKGSVTLAVQERQHLLFCHRGGPFKVIEQTAYRAQSGAVI
jgi:hypothetical protein